MGEYLELPQKIAPSRLAGGFLFSCWESGLSRAILRRLIGIILPKQPMIFGGFVLDFTLYLYITGV